MIRSLSGFLLGGAIVTSLAIASSHLQPPAASMAGAYAIDGDTIRLQSGERLRLQQIDAPELPGHCRPQRKCQPGDPYLAKAALAHLLSAGATCRGWQRDVYGRLLVQCRNHLGQDLGELLLKQGLVGRYHRPPRCAAGGK